MRAVGCRPEHGARQLGHAVVDQPEQEGQRGRTGGDRGDGVGGRAQHQSAHALGQQPGRRGLGLAHVVFLQSRQAHIENLDDAIFFE